MLAIARNSTIVYGCVNWVIGKK